MKKCAMDDFPFKVFIGNELQCAYKEEPTLAQIYNTLHEHDILHECIHLEDIAVKTHCPHVLEVVSKNGSKWVVEHKAEVQ